LVESASENGVPDEQVAEALQTRAAEVDGTRETDDDGAGDDAQRYR
jgi:hypothetical protein